jgi:hypothetical protein
MSNWIRVRSPTACDVFFAIFMDNKLQENFTGGTNVKFCQTKPVPSANEAVNLN